MSVSEIVFTAVVLAGVTAITFVIWRYRRLRGLIDYRQVSPDDQLPPFAHAEWTAQAPEFGPPSPSPPEMTEPATGRVIAFAYAGAVALAGTATAVLGALFDSWAFPAVIGICIGLAMIGQVGYLHDQSRRRRKAAQRPQSPTPLEP